MKTIPTKNGELLCVEVPMDAHTFCIESYSKPFLLGYRYKYLDDDFDIEIPHEFSIIGTITSGRLDFDAEPYVERNPSAESYEFGAVYMDYRNCDYELVARDSFLSLLISYNVEYSGKKIVILSKK